MKSFNVIIKNHTIEIFLLLIWIILRTNKLLILSQVTDDDIFKWLIMPEKILRGEFPVFLFEENRSGVFFSYISTPFRLLFPNSNTYLYYVCLLISLIFAIILYYFVRRFLCKKTAQLVLAILAVGPPLFIHWSVYACGEYITTLTLMVFAISLYFSIRFKNALKYKYFILGIVMGLSLWSHLITIALILTLFIDHLRSNKSQKLRLSSITGAGIIFGFSPYIIYELSTRATSGDFLKAIINNSQRLFNISAWEDLFHYIQNFLGLNSLPAMLSISLFIIITLIIIHHNMIYGKVTNIQRTIIGNLSLLILFIILSIFFFQRSPKIDDSSRYFLPLYIPVTVICSSYFIKIKEKLKHYTFIIPIMIIVFLFTRTVLSNKNDDTTNECLYWNSPTVYHAQQEIKDNNSLILTPIPQIEKLVQYLTYKVSPNPVYMNPLSPINFSRGISDLMSKNQIILILPSDKKSWNNCTHGQNIEFGKVLPAYFQSNQPWIDKYLKENSKIIEPRADFTFFYLSKQSAVSFLKHIQSDLKNYNIMENPLERSAYLKCIDPIQPNIYNPKNLMTLCSLIYEKFLFAGDIKKSKKILSNGCNVGIYQACHLLAQLDK